MDNEAPEHRETGEYGCCYPTKEYLSSPLIERSPALVLPPAPGPVAYTLY
jgi:hypothetical protein